ncbi:uncharacterized protein FMAN_08211 [Fusarium mangiferae]|uniref:Uncharacterized protein n=1 Tax=Fusarium mangiferae TaxID=192010 RepID=A0A1L7TYY0_FUSMA|nr:uncharacterized protein FMAN_08211 [Fusarium mangiferae]CVL02092.1 uncharacterized protein FMAN_08211 [Fusarium mangiferae]
MSSGEQFVTSSPPIVYPTISMAGVNENSHNTNLATFGFYDNNIELTHDETEAFRHIRNIVGHGSLTTGFMPALSGTSFSTEAPVEEQSVASYSVSGGYISAR